MLHNYKTKIIKELRVPDWKEEAYKMHVYADIVVEYENGSRQTVMMNEGDYKMNKYLMSIKKELSEKKFNELVEKIREYGSIKYSDALSNAAESESI